jgi:hypothetical protein
MNKDTIIWIAILGGAYVFLSTRVPIWAQQINGGWQPATVLDSLTVALTGAQPPPPVMSTAQTLVSAAGQLLTTLNNNSPGATT